MEISLRKAHENGFCGLQRGGTGGYTYYKPVQLDLYDEYEVSVMDWLKVLPEEESSFSKRDDLIISNCCECILLFETKREALSFLLENVPDKYIPDSVKELAKSDLTVSLDL